MSHAPVSKLEYPKWIYSEVGAPIMRWVFKFDNDQLLKKRKGIFKNDLASGPEKVYLNVIQFFYKFFFNFVLLVLFTWSRHTSSTPCCSCSCSRMWMKCCALIKSALQTSQASQLSCETSRQAREGKLLTKLCKSADNSPALCSIGGEVGREWREEERTADWQKCFYHQAQWFVLIWSFSHSKLKPYSATCKICFLREGLREEVT